MLSGVEAAMSASTAASDACPLRWRCCRCGQVRASTDGCCFCSDDDECWNVSEEKSAFSVDDADLKVESDNDAFRLDGDEVNAALLHDVDDDSVGDSGVDVNRLTSTHRSDSSLARTAAVSTIVGDPISIG